MSVTLEELVSVGGKGEVLKARCPDEVTLVNGLNAGHVSPVKGFVAGEYKLFVTPVQHPLKPEAFLAILHHASVDPQKLKTTFLKLEKTPGSYRNSRNIINRYDWFRVFHKCEEASDFEEDEHGDQPCLGCGDMWIINTSIASKVNRIKRSDLKVHPDHPSWVKVIELEGSSVGYLLDKENIPGMTHDFAHMFEDKYTGRYFAMIYNDAWWLDEMDREPYSLNELKYAMADFELENVF